MNKKINLWSFIISLICIILFSLAYFSTNTSILGLHPLKIIFFITLITLLLGGIGFTGIHDWKSMLRSIATLIITIGLAVFVSFIIFFGSMLS